MLSGRWTLCLLLALSMVLAGCRATRPVTPTPAPAAPTGLTAFRYTLTVEGANLFGTPTTPSPAASSGTSRVTGTITGAVVAPDRSHTRSRLDLGFLAIDTERVQVGERLWTRERQGPWIEQRVASGTTVPGTLGLEVAPSAFVGAAAAARTRAILGSLTGTPERLDGIEVLRYALTPQQLRALLALPPGSPLGAFEGASTLWVTQAEAVPVRLVTEGAPAPGATLRIEVRLTEQNSRAIVIEPPQP